MSSQPDATEVTEAELDALDDETFGPVPGSKGSPAAPVDDYVESWG